MKKVLVPLAQGCEELEAVTIIDLLRRADISVTTAGLDEKPVTASRGVILLADKTLDQCTDELYDMVVLPGGLPGSDYLNDDPRIQKVLTNTINDGHYVAAICAAPKVLANAGLLNNKRATSYPGVLDEMALPSTTLDSISPVIQDGLVITSRGPGTAMDFALKLIEVLAGKERRLDVEKGLVRS
ncbi:MAG: DJ-1/PfpI family protein [Methylococcales bacterium]|jgi:protein deglycase|nr:DJ-1/PfpI family protein [Methylococcales bacterium]MBT7446042.1 DJ-1/PfpI family protein [Methylococcales bacterium]